MIIVERFSYFNYGYDRFKENGVKEYFPCLIRHAQTRYACRKRKHFKTATAALEYGRRWAIRAESYLKAMKEIEA